MIITKIWVNKKTLQAVIAMNGSCDTRLCYTVPTQSSVIQTIHCNVGMKCFLFNFTKKFFYYCCVCIFF